MPLATTDSGMLAPTSHAFSPADLRITSQSPGAGPPPGPRAGQRMSVRDRPLMLAGLAARLAALLVPVMRFDATATAAAQRLHSTACSTGVAEFVLKRLADLAERAVVSLRKQRDHHTEFDCTTSR